jgi:hypothetical protein
VVLTRLGSDILETLGLTNSSISRMAVIDRFIDSAHAALTKLADDSIAILKNGLRI